jgi:hypothetical protein
MHIDLVDEWEGWRIRGRFLISPDGDRLTIGRIKGLAWRDHFELRREGYASRRAAEAGKRGRQYGPTVKVVIIDLQDYRVGGLAAS